MKKGTLTNRAGWVKWVDLLIFAFITSAFSSTAKSAEVPMSATIPTAESDTVRYNQKVDCKAVLPAEEKAKMIAQAQERRKELETQFLETCRQSYPSLAFEKSESFPVKGEPVVEDNFIETYSWYGSETATTDCRAKSRLTDGKNSLARAIGCWTSDTPPADPKLAKCRCDCSVKGSVKEVFTTADKAPEVGHCDSIKACENWASLGAAGPAQSCRRSE